MKIGLIIFLLNLSFIFSQSKGKDNHVEIDSENIKRHLSYLGSDLFEGRGTGTVGGNLAAKYLAQEFDRMSLIPLGDNNTFYQYIPMHANITSDESELKIYTEDREMELELFGDYLVITGSEQTLITVPIPMIFVGYGIFAPEFDYNDYQSLDVEGKIVVMLDGEPYSEDVDFFNGIYPTIYSFHESKMRTALSRGAAGSIIIPIESLDEKPDWERMKSDFLFEDISLAYSVSGNLGVLLNPYRAAFLFSDCKYSLSDIMELHREKKIESMPLKTELTFKGKFVRRDFVSSNIIGMIQGSDEELMDSYLIVSAHYDHLGIGPAVDGDSIYNGVLDNALGVSVLLELADKFSTMSVKPKRSLIFILLTGEEKGLLGSTYYTDHPKVPLYRTVANLNIDGVPVFDRFLSLVGIGAELSTLKDYLETTAEYYGLDLVDVPVEYIMTEAFNRSDQIAFAKAGIPSLLILEGIDYLNISQEDAVRMHIDYQENIYHSPFDDLKQTIDYEAVEQYTALLFHFCSEILNSDETPKWSSGSPFYQARLRSIAEKR
jgi:hypothetical protein